MICYLPESFEINGKTYAIRSNYADILEICAALNDPELSQQDKSAVALMIFYPEYKDIPYDDVQEALEKCEWFINGGEEKDDDRRPKLIDWEQDFPVIAPSINRVLGTEIRQPGKEIHWWTFLGAYHEIGDCLFAQIVRIREYLAKGKKLDKTDSEFYRRNKKLVDFKTKYTSEDEEVLKKWI